MDIIIYNNIEFYSIKDFDDYYINKNGKILSTKHNKLKILKTRNDGRGYMIVGLFKNNKQQTKRIHRLMALQFIFNKYNKPQINHIDGDKHNNNLNNLEWCTGSENIKHAYKLGLKKNQKGKLNPMYRKIGKLNSCSKKVNQYNLYGKLIKTWDCISDIERKLNISSKYK